MFRHVVQNEARKFLCGRLYVALAALAEHVLVVEVYVHVYVWATLGFAYLSRLVGNLPSKTLLLLQQAPVSGFVAIKQRQLDPELACPRRDQEVRTLGGIGFS
jgi:hypothetical protein